MKSKSKSKETIRRDKEANIRLYARRTRSDEQQLQLLEKRGAGHCKEARRLRDRISGAKQERKARRARARRP